jgi:tRNA-binding protein
MGEAPRTGSTINYEDFEKLDMRVARIVRADLFPEARKPAYKLVLDFGPSVGVRKCSAQLTTRYRPEDLVGRLVVAVVNLAPRQIGPFVSAALTLGVPDSEGAVVLVAPDADVPLGARVF